MKIGRKHYRTVWFATPVVFLIDQTLLPFEFKIVRAKSYRDTCAAIKNMTVRGAGAIGAAAGFAMAQAFLGAPQKNFWKFAQKARAEICDTRPTAQNLFFAVERVFAAAGCAAGESGAGKLNAGFAAAWAAVAEAQKIADEDAENCKKIGEIGSKLIVQGMQIETHCNAGWLAFVDYGSALSPIYLAHRGGKKIFVYVDETRPRGQGARLTAWELKNERVPHAIIPDNAGASLMAQGKIDMVIVGADRIAANGDTANKIGTLEKAIAAHEYGIPFYVAAPTSTFDLKCKSGKDIPIEERSPDEVLYQSGVTRKGKLEEILVCSPGSSALNPAFDVTPAKYITGIITEKGLLKPTTENIRKLFL
ncbi:MAG: S-methyl-5-thioribose-1-phosphate isomerase [Candidatus Margulisiibacteriota bacterium]